MPPPPKPPTRPEVPRPPNRAPKKRMHKKSLDRRNNRAYKKQMETEWDPAKNEENKAQHGLDFVDFVEFDTEPLIAEDTRYDYGEVRYRAWGRIGGTSHQLVFTMRGTTMRLISFRRAHEKELKKHG